MTPAKSPLGYRAAAYVQRVATAMMASYNAARADRTVERGSRYGTNPNSSTAGIEQTSLNFTGEWIAKNTAFGANYFHKRRQYCTPTAYTPDTGDKVLDAELAAYLKETWEHMGIGCSMMESFSRTAHVELPMRGDSGLYWYGDGSGLRLVEWTADRLGEIYQFTRPTTGTDGETYYRGIFMRGPDVVGYKIYDRIDQWYGSPQRFNAFDVIYMQDNLIQGVRGISKFAQVVDSITKQNKIVEFTMDTMAQQSKIAAIASNNSGEPDSGTYETLIGGNGGVQYQETLANGAVLRYQFNGDSYQVLRGEHPTTAFIEGLKYLREDSCLGVGFPYAFLVSARDSGGAPSRFDMAAAGREIMRLRELEAPKLNTITRVTILDSVDRKRFPARPNILRGNWNYCTLPSADSFRDDKSDISAIRAGINSPQRVIAANLGTTAEVVLRENQSWAEQVAMAVEDANRNLIAKGYKPTVTDAQISQVSDNPLQTAQSEQVSQGKSVVPTAA